MEPRGTSLKPSGAGVGGGGGAAAAMVAIGFSLACLPTKVGYSFPENAWENGSGVKVLGAGAVL